MPPPQHHQLPTAHYPLPTAHCPLPTIYDMLLQLLSILAFLGLIVAAFGLGRPILRGLGVGQGDRLSTAVWSIALGLIVGGSLLLVLGLAGVLYAPLIGVLTVVACFWGVGEMLHGYLRASAGETIISNDDLADEFDDPPQSPLAPPARWLSRAVLLAAAVACLGSLVGALAPPTAGDALCYHLELPKVFLAEHGIGDLPYHDRATFPLMTEMWYLWALALDGGVCAQLVHWGLGILLGLATVVLATPILGRPWGWIAGALVVLTPGINNQMTAPLNDVALAAMTTLALAAWWQAAVDGESRRWFVVAGLAAGGALGTKYLAIIFGIVVAGTWLWALVRRPHRRRLLLEGAGIVAVVALSIGGPWYVRAAWYRGNPVFPFFGEVFAQGDAPASEMVETLPASKSPLGRSPTAMLAAAWRVTMQPERFGGRAHQLGVLLLAAAPGVVFCRRLRGLRTLLAVAAGYGVAWFLLRQNVRFLFPMVPLLAVAVVWVWIELRRFRPAPRRIVAVAFAVVLAAMAVVPLRRSCGQLAVAVALEDRDAYLLRHEPTWPAAAVANAVLPADAHILSQDYRAFYFDRRFTRENIYRRQTRYDEDIAGPGELTRRLRDAGFTHLLLAENLTREGITYDPVLSRLADAQLDSNPAGELQPLTDYRYHDRDGAVRHYRLVMLGKVVGRGQRAEDRGQKVGDRR